MDGLHLVGSRPGSAEPPRAFNSTFKVTTPKTPKAQSTVTKYQDWLFSRPGSQIYSSPELNNASSHAPSNFPPSKVIRAKSESPVPQHKKDSSTRPSTPKRGLQRTSPSYVDETLFGDRPMTPDFPAPWDDGKKTVFVMDATDYKLQQKLKEQRERSAKDAVTTGKRASPMVASHTVLKKTQKSRQKSAQSKFKPSHVDELLFGSGSNNSSPGLSWQAVAMPTGPSHDPLNTGQMSVTGSRAPSRAGRPPSPGRPESSRSQCSPSPAGRPGSARKGGNNRHNPSYVDESLFGPHPKEADWPAPWEDREAEKTRGRPLLFDSKDYRVMINHGDAKAPSARSRSQPRPNSASSSSTKAAPWR